MHLRILEDRRAIGAAAASEAAAVLSAAIARRGQARLIAATGTSQFEFLAVLAASREVDWSRVELFHLDEYIGLPADHPAAFRRFLQERLIEPAGLTRTWLIDGQADPATVIADLTRHLRSAPVDLACVGIGENGHLAFNDPPADLHTTAAFLVVTLDDVSRQQQVGEGWFRTIDDVPAKAITMTVPQILQAGHIIGIAPDARKAAAVAACFSDGVRADAPASALLGHPHATVYLDPASAARLRPDAPPTVSPPDAAGR